jgi:hypothetical protein
MSLTISKSSVVNYISSPTKLMYWQKRHERSRLKKSGKQILRKNEKKSGKIFSFFFLILR